MNIHALCEHPSSDLAAALGEFEAKFTYPLGPGRSFQISHGEDYPRFYRAMGDARCFVAEKDGRVVGVMAAAIRPLLRPDGQIRPAAYIGDVKVDPGFRGSLVLLRLARAMDAWVRPRVDAAYGVVMDGTRVLPASYTGRAGIPAFFELAKVNVLRFPPMQINGELDIDRWISKDEQQGENCFAELCRGSYTPLGGTPAERSSRPPVWLIDPQGLACGRVEDTAAAKRLIDNDGSEMHSAHLTCFAWRTPKAAAALIAAAREYIWRSARTAMFVSVAAGESASLENALGNVPRVVAPATVYGVALSDGSAWTINSSEI